VRKRRGAALRDLAADSVRSVSRYPSRATERSVRPTSCSARGYAKKPLELKIPITIAGMSFGALSAPAKEHIGRGATAMGTSTTTGGRRHERPRSGRARRRSFYQLLPSPLRHEPDDLRRSDAIEIVVGQGAKPGGGGMLLGHKISDRVAAMRDLPKGIDQRSASRHPDWTDRTTSRSRSWSCARSPTGKSRFS